MIGIGYITRNRFKVLEYTLEQVCKNLPNEPYEIVVVDDNSDTPEIKNVVNEWLPDSSYHYNENRLGIAKSKNKCLELLVECDYYFLFDDDCYPINKDFWRYVINTGLNHCIYAKDKALNGQIKVKEEKDNLLYFESGTGCLMYFTKQVIDEIGGFNEGYQTYGHEHNGHSYRIFKAGLTPAPYISIKDLDKYVRCFDIDGLPIGLNIPFGSVDSSKQKSEQLNDIRSHFALHKDKCYSYFQKVEENTEKPIMIVGFMTKSFGGCIYYRQLIPHTVLSMSGFDYEYFDNFDTLSDEEISKFDAVSIQRASMPIVETWKRLKQLGLYIIFDTDDWLDVPENHRLYKSYTEKKTFEFIVECMKYADMVTCTTELLAFQLRPYHDNIHVFENAVDPEMPQFIPKPTKSDKFRFGYFGGLCHKPDVKLLAPVLKGISNYANCKGKYDVIMYGYPQRLNPEQLKKMTAKEVESYNEAVHVYDEYAKILTDDGKIPLKTGSWQHVFNYMTGYNTCDCSLVPLQDDFFNAMKSELKLVEAGFMRKAVIVSKVDPYLELGKDKHNCLMCESTNDWIQAMKLLIHEPEYAKELGENLYNSVKDKYNIFAVNERRKLIYKKYINEHRNRVTG